MCVLIVPVLSVSQCFIRSLDREPAPHFFRTCNTASAGGEFRERILFGSLCSATCRPYACANFFLKCDEDGSAPMAVRVCVVMMFATAGPLHSNKHTHLVVVLSRCQDSRAAPAHGLRITTLCHATVWRPKWSILCMHVHREHVCAAHAALRQP